MSGRRKLLVAGLAASAWFLNGTTTLAQTAERTQPRLAASVGPQWLGSTDVGGLDAVETANGPGTRTLFETKSQLEGGLGVSASLGIRVTGGLWAEASVRYHSARLSTEVSQDLEGANGTASESLQHFQIEGGALWAPEAWHLGWVQLYGSGGAGYVRQLHSGQTLAEEGQSFYAGAGLVVWLPQRAGRPFNTVGVRIDPRAVFLKKGVAFDDGLHTAAAVAASLFLRF